MILLMEIYKKFPAFLILRDMLGIRYFVLSGIRSFVRPSMIS